MSYDRIALRSEIEREEGRVDHAYQDHLGFLTIGIGHLIDKRKGGSIPGHIINALFDHDIAQCENQLDAYVPWWRTQSDARQRALLNMCFQLGIGGLLKFAKMLGGMQAGDYEEAYRQALDSGWAKQTPARARRVAEMIRKG